MNLKSEKFCIRDFLIKNSVFIVLIVMIIISSSVSPFFFSKRNIFNIFRQYSPLMVVVVGMLYVLVSGGIDLSVGAVVSFGGIMTALTMDSWRIGQNNAWGLAVAILIVVGASMLFGVFNGFMVAHFKMKSFIVTLASSMIIVGCNLLMSGGHPWKIPAGPGKSAAGSALQEFGIGTVPLLGVPWPILVAVIIILVFAWILNFTGYGRLIIATGSNSDAVKLAGQNLKFYQMTPFVIVSGLSGLAGAMLAARATVATAGAGDVYTLDAIAGCVIGGASLDGGRGSVIKAIVGVMIIALIANILSLLSVPPYPQQVLKGFIIIVAVLVQVIRQ